MTLSLAGTRKDAGVSIAEVNLKLIWDVVSQIKVGEHGHAYVVGSQGRLIAHPDISLVLRNTDMSKLVQVQAALAEQAAIAKQQDEAAAALAAAQAASGARPSSQPAQPRRHRRGSRQQHRLPAGRAEHPGPGGADCVSADLAAALDHVRRTAGGGSLCLALCGAAAACRRAARRIDLRGARRNLPRAPHGRPDPGLARRRRADRQRRFRPAHLDQDRRRAGRSRQPVQRHGRAPAGILCGPREQGRAAHGGVDGVAAAADRDVGSARNHQLVSRRAGAGVPEDAGECDADLRRQVRHHDAL